MAIKTLDKKKKLENRRVGQVLQGMGGLALVGGGKWQRKE
jgi:hypothetical protein